MEATFALATSERGQEFVCNNGLHADHEGLNVNEEVNKDEL